LAPVSAELRSQRKRSASTRASDTDVTAASDTGHGFAAPAAGDAEVTDRAGENRVAQWMLSLFRRSQLHSTRDPTSTEPERKEMKTIAAILAAAVLSFVAGCNTMEGAGKDVQAGGRAVERAADKSNPTADPKKY
jgi:entericidin B